MASRRQKGPSAEEQIEKLEKKFNVFEEEHRKELELIRNDHEVSIAQLRYEYEEEIKKLQDEIKKSNDEYNLSLESLKNDQSKQWDSIKLEIIEQLNDVKVEIETCNAESEESFKTANEDILQQLEEHRVNLNNVDSKLVAITNEISKRINDESTELVANQDIFKDEAEQKMNDINQLCDDRYEEIGEVIKLSDKRREEYFKDFKDDLKGLNLKIEEVLDSVGITIQDKLKETNMTLQNKMALEAQEAQSHRAEIEFDVSGLKEKIESIDQGLSEVNEKLHEFEQNKRNNLIFYGLNNEIKETPDILLSKIQTIIRVTLGVRRDIPIPKVTRMYNGPEISGSRPVLVTFENFKDREEVLRKGNLLKGSNIHISEDLSKRTRESRAELRKYMRKVKKLNPDATCFMQYDKLYINNKIYVFNDLQGRVVEQNQMEDPIAMSLASLVMSRPGSVMDDRPGSAMSVLSGISPTKTPVRSRRMRNATSMNSVDFNKDDSISGDRIRDLEYQLSSQQENFAAKMRDMENIIKRQEDMLARMKINDHVNHVNGEF